MSKVLWRRIPKLYFACASHGILAKAVACRAERGRPPGFHGHLLSGSDFVSLAVGQRWAPFAASVAGADAAAWATQLKPNLSGPLVLEEAAGRGTPLRGLCACLRLSHIILQLPFYFRSLVTSVCSRESSAFFPCHLSNTERENR